MPGALELSGLDGTNPLAFLAALGTLRILTIAWPSRGVKLHWAENGGAWRPLISAENPPLIDTLAARTGVGETLASALKATGDEPFLRIDDPNLKLDPSAWRGALRPIQEKATRDTRTTVDFFSSLGTEGDVDRHANIRRSALQMVNGGKRQDFLPIIKNLVSACTAEHISNTLFERWAYADSMVSLNLRWDPVDDRLYALRWDDPSDSRTIGRPVLS